MQKLARGLASWSGAREEERDSDREQEWSKGKWGMD